MIAKCCAVSPKTKEEVITCVKLAAGKKVAVLSGGHLPMCMPSGAFLIIEGSLDGAPYRGAESASLVAVATR